MIVMQLKVKNVYRFKDINTNFTYPRKTKNTVLQNEYLKEFPNFRYRKVNILMGANSSGKTSFGKILMSMFNYIDKKQFIHLQPLANYQTKNSYIELYFVIDNHLNYCEIEFNAKGIINEVYKCYKIKKDDSYEKAKMNIDQEQTTEWPNHREKLKFGWFFSYTNKNDMQAMNNINPSLMEVILKTFDPSIKNVKKIPGVDNGYKIQFLNNETLLMQDGQLVNKERLSSGTVEALNIIAIISMLDNDRPIFIDEKISHAHSELEVAIINLIINIVKEKSQVFITSHNYELLEMNLPIHSYKFFKNNHEIEIIDPIDKFKKNDRNLLLAVKNDFFTTIPDVSKIDDLIYEISSYE